MTWPAPKRSPLCATAARMRRASAVPSARGACSRQLSQLPQGAALFAEIAEQHLAAAFGRLAIADQRVEPAMRAALVLVGGVLVVDEHAAHADVAEAVQHMRLGRPPSRPARPISW